MKSHNDSLSSRNEFVRHVVNLLAAQEYSALQLLSGGKRLSGKDIQNAVAEYGRTIIPLPDAALQKIDYVAIAASKKEAWSVQCPIFTVEEGLSDLTLELRLQRGKSDNYEVTLDGLHVL